MIFDIFSITRLAKRLASNTVQDKNALLFLIVGDVLFVVFSFISSYVLGFSYLEYEAALVEAAITVVIIVVGIFACYGAYSGSNFFRDFIVLSVPALIYATLLNWLAHWSVIYAVGTYGETTSFATQTAADASMAFANKILEVGAVAAMIIGSFSFFYFVRVGLRIAGEQKRESQ